MCRRFNAPPAGYVSVAANLSVSFTPPGSEGTNRQDLQVALDVLAVAMVVAGVGKGTAGGEERERAPRAAEEHLSGLLHDQAWGGARREVPGREL